MDVSSSVSSKENVTDGPSKDVEQMDTDATTTMDVATAKKKSGKTRRKERKLKNEPSSVVVDTVPDALQVVDFVEARAKELSAMVHAVTNKGGAKRTFQKLPRHMRRRAASFNVRRLPHQARESAVNEVHVHVRWVWSKTNNLFCYKESLALRNI